MKENNNNKKLLIGLMLIGIIFCIVIVYVILKGTYSIKIEDLDDVVINDSFNGKIEISCDKTEISFNQTATCIVSAEYFFNLSVPTGNGITSFSAGLILDEGVVVEDISYDNTKWQGDVTNGKIDLYTVGDYYHFGREVFKFVVKSVDSKDKGNKQITLKDIIISADRFKEYKISDSEDGSLSTTIKILSNDDTLKELSIEGIDFEFSPDVITYNLKTDEEEIVINAVASNEYAEVTGGGTKKLNYGNNILNIKVIAENGLEKIYTLIVLRGNEKVNFAKDVLIDSEQGYLMFSVNDLFVPLTVNNVLDKIFTDASVSVTDKDGNTMTDYDDVGTGDRVKIYEEEETFGDYTVVIKGDVDGTGKITIKDANELIKHYIGNKKLTKNEYISAGDINNDGKISINDIVILSKRVVRIR